jgi:hypothetical protein
MPLVSRRRRRIFRNREVLMPGGSDLMCRGGLVGIFRGCAGRCPGVGAVGDQQGPGDNGERRYRGNKQFAHCSLHLIETSQTQQGRTRRLGPKKPWTGKDSDRERFGSAFPIDDSVRRLVVPSYDDPGFREAQESMSRCSKNEQQERRLKRWQMVRKGSEDTARIRDTYPATIVKHRFAPPAARSKGDRAGIAIDFHHGAIGNNPRLQRRGRHHATELLRGRRL